MSEFEQKQQRVRALLAEKNLDALLLQRVSSFAWATCGAASYVNTATRTGAASLLITPTARYLVTNNIEAPRLEREEGLAAQGWEFRVTPHTDDVVAAGQAYAWNPSIAGAKSEDTILVGAERNEVLTPIEGWATVTVEVDGQRLARPAILEIT